MGYLQGMVDVVAPPNRTTVQLNFRAPPDVAQALDAWVEELKSGRHIPVTRNSVLLSLLLWGLRERPSWVGGDPLPGDAEVAALRAEVAALRAQLAEQRLRPSPQRFVEPDEVPAPAPPPRRGARAPSKGGGRR